MIEWLMIAATAAVHAAVVFFEPLLWLFKVEMGLELVRPKSILTIATIAMDKKTNKRYIASSQGGNMTTRLFVYGTLKRDGRAYRILSKWEPKFIGESKTHNRYHLYDQGYYPGMVENASQVGGVYGEVFEVCEGAMHAMDYYEGVDSNLFRRQKIELEDGSFATAYMIVNPITDNRIQTGRWNNDG